MLYRLKDMIRKAARTPPEVVFYKLRGKLKRSTVEDQLDPRECECVFFLSTGRVGTQSAAALLGLEGAFLTYHEPDPSLFELSKAVYESGPEGADSAVAEQAMLLARRQFLENALIRGKGYIETSPQATFLAPVIERCLPNSRFIHLIRNPYDVIRSGMRRRWYDGHVADRGRIVPRDGTEFEERWDRMSALEKITWLWMETNEWIDNFLTEIPDSRKARLTFESCFDGRPESAIRLFDSARIPPPNSRKIGSVLSSRLNAQRSGRYPKVDHWEPDIKRSVEAIAGHSIERFGYSVVR